LKLQLNEYANNIE